MRLFSGKLHSQRGSRLVCSCGTKQFHGVLAFASFPKLGCGRTKPPPPFARTNPNTHKHGLFCIHRLAGCALRPSVLRASDTLRFSNRRASRECTRTEDTLSRSEKMTDCCTIHLRTTLRNLPVPPVVGVCLKMAEVKGDLKKDFFIIILLDMSYVVKRKLFLPPLLMCVRTLVTFILGVRGPRT